MQWHRVTAVAAPGPRPETAYKRELRSRVEALAPLSLLDVGCGSGSLLEWAGARCRAVGVEVSADLVEPLTGRGLDARVGAAEALPFADRSFDAVVMEYVAHHARDVELALRETIRVARRYVLILDGWFDLAWPSQSTAHALEQWRKAIDQRNGLIHHVCFSEQVLCAPFLRSGEFAVHYGKRLALQEMTQEELDRALAAAQPGNSRDAVGADLIRQQAAVQGITHEGALLLEAHRIDEP